MRRRPAPASLPVSRLPFLEGLRGLAALLVVLGHFCSMADGRRAAGWVSHAPEWLYRTMGAFWYGNLAVAAFIVLSGFCLQLSLFNRADGKVGDLKRFYKRRSMRILPPYYAALGLSILVALHVTQHQQVPPFTMYVPVTTENVVAHALLVHNFSPAWMYKLNGVLWSIAIEAQLYLVFPLLALGFLKLGRLGTLLLTSALAVAVMMTVPTAPKLYPWFAPLFVLGMVAAHMAYRPNLRIGTKPVWGAVLGVGFLGGTIYACSQNAALYAQDVPIGIAVACLCYVLTTTEQGLMCDILSWRPIVFLGGFSYSLYLMHHPIQQLIYVNRPEWVNDEVSGVGFLLVVGLPIILIGTYLFHLAFEKPFMPRRTVTKLDAVQPVLVSLPLRTYTGAGSHPNTSAPSPKTPVGVSRASVGTPKAVPRVTPSPTLSSAQPAAEPPAAS